MKKFLSSRACLTFQELFQEQSNFKKWFGLTECGLVMPSWSILVRVIAWHLLSAQTLSKPLLTYFQSDPAEHIFSKILFAIHSPTPRSPCFIKILFTIRSLIQGAPNPKTFSSLLAVVFAQSMEARC